MKLKQKVKKFYKDHKKVIDAVGYFAVGAAVVGGAVLIASEKEKHSNSKLSTGEPHGYSPPTEKDYTELDKWYEEGRNDGYEDGWAEGYQAGRDDEHDILTAYCGDDDDCEEEDTKYVDPCVACGGDYPNCSDSCPLFED